VWTATLPAETDADSEPKAGWLVGTDGRILKIAV
jgi:hypothetical protein